jgi:hypothetical protein
MRRCIARRLPDGEPRAGDNVRLSGTVVVTDPDPQRVIVLRPARVEFIAYDVPLEVSPARVSVHTGDAIQFLAARDGLGHLEHLDGRGPRIPQPVESSTPPVNTRPRRYRRSRRVC